MSKIKQFYEWILFKWYKWRGYEMIFLSQFERGDVFIIKTYSSRCLGTWQEKRKVLAKHKGLAIINSKPNYP